MTRATSAAADSGRTGRSATGGVRLLLRHLRSGTGPSVLVATVVLASSFLALVAPLALGRLADAEVASRLGGVSDVRRALTGFSPDFPYPDGPAGSTAEVWRSVERPVQKQRASLPRPLTDALGRTLYEVRTTAESVGGPRASSAFLKVALSADPDFAPHVRWVQGAPPALWSGSPEDYFGAPSDSGDGEDTRDIEAADPLPIGLSARAAASMELRVGDVLTRTQDVPLLVAGIYQPTDLDDPLWRFHGGLTRAVNDPTPDGETQWAATAAVSPRTPGIPGPLSRGSLSIITPVRADAWSAAEAPVASAQLSAATASGIDLPDPGGTGVVLVTTDATAALDDAVALNGAILTVTTLVAAGSVAVALLALALGIGAVLDRRRPALDLAAARGARPWRLRGAVGLEGLVVGVPAAIVGAVLAFAVLPGTPPPSALSVCALLGLAPGVVAVAADGPRSVRTVRTDLGMRRGRRWRIIAEGGVVLLAIAVTATLVLRGRAQDPSTIDPLLVTAPVLLAIAAGLVTLRAYPVPLRIAQAALRRGRRAPAFLGIARGIREPTLGLAATLAILIGVAVGVLAAVLVGTVDTATRDAARATLGADIRADLTLSDPSARVPRVPGLRDVAPIAAQGSVPFGAASIDLVTAPTDALHRIRDDVPDGMTRLRDGAIPLLVSDDVARRVGERVSLADHPAVVVGKLPTDAQYGPTRQWGLVDHRFLARLVPRPTRAVLLLADADPGASPHAVASRLRAALPDGAIVSDAESRYDELRAIPSVGGLNSALALAAGVAAALAVLTAVLAVVAATRRRDRTVALLRVLGLSRAQVRRMVAAELAPVALALVVAGTALGIGLARLTTALIDLRPFTGGDADVQLVLSPAPIALIAVSFLVLAGVAAAVAARISSRVRPADVIRTGE